MKNTTLKYMNTQICIKTFSKICTLFFLLVESVKLLLGEVKRQLNKKAQEIKVSGHGCRHIGISGKILLNVSSSQC